MKVALIVAMDAERGIGKNNDLMWHLPADMRFFKETTKEHIVVMGRRNYDSIPEKYRPLANRLNVILTRNQTLEAPNCLIFHSLEDCLNAFQNETERTVFIIGGGEIYQLALQEKCIDEMFISHVEATFSADVFFPEITLDDWKSSTVITQEIDDKHPYRFITKHYDLIQH